MRSPIAILTGNSLRSNQPAFFRELKSLALILLLVFSFRWSVAEPYQVPTGSMEPTIEPGDRLFVLKAAYELNVPFTHFHLLHVTEPERGDVIVFKSTTDSSIDLIKRLIGLPGDHVEVTDGAVSINGKPVPMSEPREAEDSREAGGARASLLDYQETLGKVHYSVQRLPHLRDPQTLRFDVPQGQYFFMGDNRDNSNDSRFWGFVPAENLKGRALVVWLSLERRPGSSLPHIRWERFGRAL